MLRQVAGMPSLVMRRYAQLLDVITFVGFLTAVQGLPGPEDGTSSGAAQ